jgi:hypothetical protein
MNPHIHGTIAATRANGLVHQNAFIEAVASPTESGLLSRLSILFMDGMRQSVRLAAWLRSRFEHPVHPMRFKTQTVVYQPLEGA